MLWWCLMSIQRPVSSIVRDCLFMQSWSSNFGVVYIRSCHIRIISSIMKRGFRGTHDARKKALNFPPCTFTCHVSLLLLWEAKLSLCLVLRVHRGRGMYIWRGYVEVLCYAGNIFSIVESWKVEGKRWIRETCRIIINEYDFGNTVWWNDIWEPKRNRRMERGLIIFSSSFSCVHGHRLFCVLSCPQQPTKRTESPILGCCL